MQNNNLWIAAISRQHSLLAQLKIMLKRTPHIVPSRQLKVPYPQKVRVKKSQSFRELPRVTLGFVYPNYKLFGRGRLRVIVPGKKSTVKCEDAESEPCQ